MEGGDSDSIIIIPKGEALSQGYDCCSIEQCEIDNQNRNITKSLEEDNLMMDMADKLTKTFALVEDLQQRNTSFKENLIERNKWLHQLENEFQTLCIQKKNHEKFSQDQELVVLELRIVNQALQKENAEHLKKIEELSLEIHSDENKSELIDLQKQIDALKEQIVQNECTHESVKDNLSQMLNAYESNVNDLKMQLKKKTNELENAITCLNEKGNEVADLTQKFDDMEKQCTENLYKESAWDVERKSLIATQEELKLQVTQLTEELQEKNEEMAHRQSYVDGSIPEIKLEERCDALKKQCAESEKALRDAKTSEETLKLQISEFTIKLEEKFEAKRNKARHYKNLLHKKEADYDDILRKNKELVDDHGDLKMSSEDLNFEMKKKLDELEKLKEENKDLLKQISKLVANQQNLENQLKEEREKCSSYQSQEQITMNEIQNLCISNQEKDQIVQKLNEDLKRVTNEIKDKEVENSLCRKQAYDLEVEYTAFLDKHDFRVSQFQSEIRTLKDEILSLAGTHEENVAELRHEIVDWKCKGKDLESQINEMINEMQSKQNEIDTHIMLNEESEAAHEAEIKKLREKIAEKEWQIRIKQNEINNFPVIFEEERQSHKSEQLRLSEIINDLCSQIPNMPPAGEQQSASA